jgi:phenylalanyl-tRNA synthetase beta chain
VKVPYEWLSEFVVLQVDPHELANSLTMRGLEVEAIEEFRPTYSDVVVGEVTKVEKHPNAENLSLCSVNTGTDTLLVVCGAPNVEAGKRVPLAKVGATLAGGFAIEARKIRDIESEGMLCSERELGLSDDHSGIFILPDDLPVGKPLDTAPWARDFVFDVNVPPNRGDCLSIYGIAREVGSILNQKAKLPHVTLNAHPSESIEAYMDLDVLDTTACPRYVLRMLKGLTIVPSPFWMRNRIAKCGMRPINSVVDVTNYIMLELGQPLHAFDYRKLRDNRIEVRVTEKEMPFRTLDGTDRDLVPGDILICDGKGPVAIAGIMGGENSEISSGTEDVALESAYFNPLFVRKTARRLGIRSEASLRFEKGIDVDNVDFAAERAIYLMEKISGGRVVRGKKEVNTSPEVRNIFVAYGRVNGILGTHVDQKEITRNLRSIDIHVVKEEEEGLLIAVPNFRHDLTEYMDIIEEIARLYGFEHIPPTQPISRLGAQKRDTKDVYLTKIKDYFRGAGCFEVINFAFFGVRDIENFKIPEDDKRYSFVPIINPISKEYEVMRTFMSANVLKCIAYNLNRAAKNLRFFETGKTFYRKDEGLPEERFTVCFAITGQEREFYWKESYHPYDFYDMRGLLEGLMGVLKCDFSVDTTREPFLNTNVSADIVVDGEKVGWIGEIRDDVLKAYGIEQTVYCAEIGFEVLARKGTLDPKFSPIPRYPQVVRDFSFYVDEAIKVGSLMEEIKGVSPLVTSVGVFDMFKKERRSVSLRVVFQSFEDTLKEETISELQETIIKKLSSINGVSLRT